MTTLRHQTRFDGLLWLVLAWLMLSTPAAAQPLGQEKHRLSLKQALEQARTENYELLQARADRRAAGADLQSSRAAFLPQVSISEIATTTNDPLNAFGFKLEQEIVSQADFVPSLLNDPDRIDNFTTRFEIRQAVLNPDALFRHRAARSQEHAAASRVERTGHHIDFLVKQQYFRLALVRRSLTVIDSALVAAKANQSQAGRFFEQGLITRADLLEAEVRVLELESRRTEADFSVRNTSDQLRYLLGVEESVEIVPIDSLRHRPIIVGRIDTEEINQRRSDMEALRSQRTAAHQALRASRMRFVPTLNVYGAYDLNDRNMFGSSGNSWTVGATLKWSLFAGLEQIGGVERAKANLQKSQIAYQSQAVKNQLDIEATLRGILQTQKQLDLASKAKEQARENLRIRSDRYAEGLEKTMDVLNAEVMLANQELAYLETLYLLYVNVFKLEMLLERPVLT